MALKKESTRKVESYEFILTHDDVVDLMNDAQVQLKDGNVLSNQVMELILIKGGSEIKLRQFRPSDKISFKFNVVSDDGTSEAVGDLDVL